MDNLKRQIIQVSIKHKSKIQDVNVMCNGGPITDYIDTVGTVLLRGDDIGEESGESRSKG